MSPHEFKALQTRLAEARNVMSHAKVNVTNAQREYDEARKKVQSLEARIEQGQSQEPVVTEHAMLRFLQRVYGIDLDVVRETILTDQVKSLIEFCGTGKVPLEGYDCDLVVKNRAIVTVEDR